MLDRWLAARLAKNATVRLGGETFREPQEDRFGCLLIHGWAGSPSEMRPVGDYLARHGIDVYGVRLAGHGTSTWDLSRSTHQDWLNSAELALQSYLAEKDRVVLCGFSMGGVIALHLAGTYADDPRIIGVATLSTPLRFRQGREARHALLARLWRRLRQGSPHTHKPNAASELVNYRFVSPRSLLELMRLLNRTVSMLPKVRQPLLVVQSFADQTVPAFNAELIYNGVSSPEKHLVWVNESGHMITVDHDADTVAEEIGRFVLALRDRYAPSVTGKQPAPAEVVPVGPRS